MGQTLDAHARADLLRLQVAGLDLREDVGLAHPERGGALLGVQELRDPDVGWGGGGGCCRCHTGRRCGSCRAGEWPALRSPSIFLRSGTMKSIDTVDVLPFIARLVCHFESASRATARTNSVPLLPLRK